MLLLIHIKPFLVTAKVGWLLGCRIKANCPRVEPRPTGAVSSVGSLSKGS